MCGICGFNYRDEGLLKEMLQQLRHRGPDSEGLYTDQDFSLGMRRLSIIDLQGGNQPLWNESKTVCAFLNGELYNFPELREVLLNKGHRFSSHSDTEVLVHLYEDHGTDFVHSLKGMFAFCIYDLEKKKLLLGRDRFGEKPLYYSVQNGLFAFASELTSLLTHPHIKRKLNAGHLQTLLHFGFTISPETLFEHVHSLPPGHLAIYENKNLRTSPYFRIAYSAPEEPCDEQNYLKNGKELLYKAVDRSMRSDVPIGAFLSGGIDSSSVAAIMQELRNEKLDTFTVKFEESDFDESILARKVSRSIGSNHHELLISNKSFDIELFHQMILHFGQPFADSSAIPSYLISKKISEYVRVALSGDGGDEVFGGYQDFLWAQRISALSNKNSFLRKSLYQLLQALPKQSFFFPNLLRGIEKALQLSFVNKEELWQQLFELFGEQDIHSLYLKPSYKISYPVPPSEFNRWTILRQMMWLRAQVILAEDMLVKIDRMSMCHSLEVRAPFLDIDLYNFSIRLPDSMLIRNQQTKYLLRTMMKHKLPPSVFTHPKQGFSIPLHFYFTNEFSRYVNHLIQPNHPLHRFLDYQYVLSTIKTGLTNKHSNSRESVYKTAHKAWLLIQLYAWYEQFKPDLPEY